MPKMSRGRESRGAGEAGEMGGGRFALSHKVRRSGRAPSLSRKVCRSGGGSGWGLEGGGALFRGKDTTWGRDTTYCVSTAAPSHAATFHDGHPVMPRATAPYMKEARTAISTSHTS